MISNSPMDSMLAENALHPTTKNDEVRLRAAGFRWGDKGTHIAVCAEDCDVILDDHPFLPVRRRFWEHVLRAVGVPGTAASSALSSRSCMNPCSKRPTSLSAPSSRPTSSSASFTRICCAAACCCRRLTRPSEQQKKILVDEDLYGLPALSVGAEADLTRTLEQTPLSAWKTRTDALPQQFARAAMAARFALALKRRVQFVGSRSAREPWRTSPIKSFKERALG
jgi:hypothetical protein